MVFSQTLRYIKPPDSLLTQLDVYSEEKFEDEEDVRERTRTLMSQGFKAHQRTRSDSEVVFQDLIQLAKQHGELYPMMVDILKHYGLLLQRDVGMYAFYLCDINTRINHYSRQLKADLFIILDRFVEQAAMLENL